MPWWLFLLIGIPVHAVMWPVATRLHWKNWPWVAASGGCYDTSWSKEEQVYFSAFIGFLWPASLALWGVFLITRLVTQAATIPSRQERKTARIEDLKQATKKAESEYQRVCAALERIKEQ